MMAACSMTTLFAHWKPSPKLKDLSAAARPGPTGLLRLGTPVAFGRLHVAPYVGAFLRRFPDVEVELSMDDAFVDLVGHGLDLAVRIGDLGDPSLIARRIGTTRRVTVAAADYLERRGVPETPADLVHHDCVVYTRLATGNRWPFDGPNGAVTADVHGRFRADNSEAVREAVIGSAGIAVIPVWLFGDEIKSGRVRIVLQAFEPTPLPIHAVYLLAPASIGEGARDDRIPRHRLRLVSIAVHKSGRHKKTGPLAGEVAAEWRVAPPAPRRNAMADEFRRITCRQGHPARVTLAPAALTSPACGRGCC